MIRDDVGQPNFSYRFWGHQKTSLVINRLYRNINKSIALIFCTALIFNP